MFESNIDGVIVALGGKTSDVGDTMLTGKVARIVMFLFICIMHLTIIPCHPKHPKQSELTTSCQQ